MRPRRLATSMAFCVSLLAIGQTGAMADTYDSAVQNAEELWREGKKVEAVQLYGSVWQQKPDDLERQILYGERSAEVGFSRWAINFLRVAESNAQSDPDRLRKVYLGYAKVYRTLGYTNTARSYEEKAGVQEPPRRDSVPTPMAKPSGYFYGYYTETPPGGKVAIAPRPTPRPTAADPTAGHLRKRIALTPVGDAVGRSDLGRYAAQVRAMLIDGLRKTGRFAIVEDASQAEALLDSMDRAPGPPGKGRSSLQTQTNRVHLLVRTQITDFTNLAPGSRHFDIGPVSVDRGRSRVRLGMTVWLYDGLNRKLVASENVSIEKAADTTGGGLSLSFSGPRDWDLQNSILGPATSDLVQKVVATILSGAEGVSWEARVIRGSGREVEFDMGSQEGVRVGDRFRIIAFGEGGGGPGEGRGRGAGKGNGRGRGRGNNRGAKERDVGEIEVIRVDSNTAVGRVLRKEGPFDAGARVVPSRLAPSGR